MRRHPSSRLLGTLLLPLLLAPRSGAAFFEDLCFDGGVAINCVDVQCPPGAPASACEAAITAQAVARAQTGASVTTSSACGPTVELSAARSMVHMDATYLLALVAGLRADVALAIAMYDQAMDNGVYVPRDATGAPVEDACRWQTARLSGLERLSAQTGGFIWHLGVAHPLQTARDPSADAFSGLTPDLTDLAEEGGLARMRQWVVDGSKLCAVGLTEGEGGSLSFDGSRCLGMSPILRVMPAAVDQRIHGAVPVFEQMLYNTFTAWTGDQALGLQLSQDGSGDPTRLVFEGQLQRVLDAAPGRLDTGVPVDAVIARMGIYLHMLQDRISHHACGDASGLLPGPDGVAVLATFDQAACATAPHAVTHYEEVGFHHVPARTLSALRYTLSELRVFRAAVAPDHPAWVTREVAIDEGRLIGTEAEPGLLTAALREGRADERLTKMNLLLDALELPRMPGLSASGALVEARGGLRHRTPQARAGSLRSSWGASGTPPSTQDILGSARMASTQIDRSPIPAHTLHCVLVRIGDQLCGIPVAPVREILIAPKAVPAPGSERWVRGVFNIRGQVLAALDVRARLGLVSALDERQALIESLRERRQDHIAWLDELEISIREDRRFGLTLDPHRCKFGLWYDSYKPTNPMLSYQLSMFADPHRRIHALGATVAGLRDRGQQAEALEIVLRARTTVLAQMLTLFDELEKVLTDSAWEIAVSVQVEGHPFALIVDGVESLEHLLPQDESAGSRSTVLEPPVRELYFRKGKEAVVPILDVALLSTELRPDRELAS